jgi:hypothetical protein
VILQTFKLNLFIIYLLRASFLTMRWEDEPKERGINDERIRSQEEGITDDRLEIASFILSSARSRSPLLSWIEAARQSNARTRRTNVEIGCEHG